MPGTAAYDAFVSYSHAADGVIAPALRLALHKFAKPWYKTRALSVFLDQSSLSANPGLWPAIERALSSAAHFILLASPESAASPWVRKEIEWWLTNRSVDSMLVLLTGGELIWNTGATDFDWTRTTSLSRDFAGRFPAEPLYVDLRWARAEGTYNLRHAKFRAAVLDVAAPLHRRNKDELDGEDIRQGRRTMRLARAGVAMITIAAGVAIWQAIAANQQRREAERQRDEAVRQRDTALSRQLAAEAGKQFANPLQGSLASLLTVESLRKAQHADNYEMAAQVMRDGARMVATFPGDFVADFSQDGQLIATQEQSDLVVRDARSGTERARIPATGASYSLCFTPDSQRVLMKSRDGAGLFDIAAKRELQLPGTPSSGSTVNASQNCRFLAVVRDRAGQLIALETNVPVGTFAVPPNISALAAGNDGDVVAYAEGPRAAIVSARSTTVRANWLAPRNVTGLAFDRDAKWLTVLLGAQGSVRLDAMTGQPIATSAATGTLTPAADLSFDLGTDKRELVVWDVVKGAWSKRTPLLHPATDAAWSDDGEFLIYGGGEGDGAARVFQSGSWRQLARFAFDMDVSSLTPGSTPPAVWARVSPSGNLASATWNRRVGVFEIHHDRPIVTLPAEVRPGPVALSADGRRAAFRRLDRKVVVVDAASGEEIVSFDCVPVARGQYLQLSESGGVLAAACGGSSLVVYDIDARRQSANLVVDYGAVQVMSRDGTLVHAGSAVVGTTNGERVRDVGSGVPAFDPAGRQVAVADRSGINLFDLRTAAPPRHIDAEINQFESLAFSHDGARLAAGARDMRVRIFDTSTGKMLQRLEHIDQDQWTFRIHRLVFSPSGRLIATMVDDPTMLEIGRRGAVRVFEVDTGREIARFRFDELEHDLRFAPDDSSLEIAVGRRRIRWERYPLSAAGLIAEVCGRVRRNMNAIEWARFMKDEPQRDTCPGAGQTAGQR